jgi:type I restriction enzyme M protein
MHSADNTEDILGRVYEYFLGRFGANEGGQFYTPRQVVQLLVEMLEPYRGRIFDPACGSGGMFVQSARFVDAHGGRRGDVRVFGQEAVATTWRLAKMNLAIRHIEADLGPAWGDSFHNDQHPDLRADFVIANPPFNLDEWGGERLKGDPRWVYGDPPAGNANFAWVQHFLSHLAPTGTAGFILANGALSIQGVEGDIRRKLIEADLVDCVVALPTNLFFGTTIPVSLWFLTKSKRGAGRRARAGETLFIDARALGQMATRVQRVLSPEDVGRVAGAYRSWRSSDGDYMDIPGFVRSTDIAEIAANNWALAPARYVGSSAPTESDEDIRERLSHLQTEVVAALDRASAASTRLRAALELLETDGG